MRGSSSTSSSAASASSARSWETSTTPPRALGQQRAEALEAVGVEVVGRLVEEDDVEAGRAQGREAGARRLAAGQRAQRAVEQVGAEAELGGGRGEAGLGVVAAEREPALEGGRVRLERVEVAGRERLGQRVDAPLGGGDADALEDRRAHARAGVGAVVRELRQIADGAVRANRPGVGRLEAGEDPEQGRLPRPVGADQGDAAPGVDAEVDGVEEGAGAVVAGDAAGVEEGRRHAGSFRCEGDGRTAAAGVLGRSVLAAVSERHACDGPEGRR